MIMTKGIHTLVDIIAMLKAAHCYHGGDNSPTAIHIQAAEVECYKALRQIVDEEITSVNVGPTPAIAL